MTTSVQVLAVVQYTYACEYKPFLASRSLYAIARPSVVCRLSVMLVRPTQAVEIFSNISRAFGNLAIR